MQAKQTVSYDDILLSPQYSNIKSRTDINIGNGLGGRDHFSLPIIASPMDTISGIAMAHAMYDAGGLCIFHRYSAIKKQASQVTGAIRGRGAMSPAAAIGVTGEYLDRARALYDAGAHILCIDVAHGHHNLMKNALQELRKVFGNTVHIMAGNVATLEGFVDVATWGADSVRVGVGGGSICSTRIQTGHGIPTLESIIATRVAKHGGRFKNVKVIADGGIKSSGDIVKALACGADFVMVGSLLAGSDECPGEIIETREGKFKAYRGMASKDAQLEWRGKTASLEGVSTVVPYRGPVADILTELDRGIRSGLSYSGARSIRELQEKAQFVIQSPAGQAESSTHILNR
jgi:IMP dehydrogenase|tara:strand:+ start:2859 stop:3896 length:1038 start_codon:yes stop_codon:yes gene_type:complete